MASKFLEGEKYRGLCRQISIGGGEFIESGQKFKEDWDYAEMLRKEIESYLAGQLQSYREMGGRPLSSSTRWIGDNFYIYMFGKSSSNGERVEFHASNLCVGKCSAAILKKLIEELEDLDAYRLNKALASMI
jgi:hypothetical protein